ncbi:MAG TPA: hypothetical protein VKS60_11450 [Stellaceae bacterium]|nr:hypothetical protein [Stellaceae bacterium]
MPEKDYELSKVAAPAAKDLKTAFAAARKALAANGIPLGKKEPNWTEIAAFMEKSKQKKAAFMLKVDWPKVVLFVDLGSAARELDTLQLDKQKTVDDKKALVAGLVKGKWAEASRLDEFKVLDSMKLVAENISVQRDFLAKLQAQRAFYTGLTYRKIRMAPSALKDLEAFAKAEFNHENTMFLAAVYANASNDDLIAKYIDPKSQTQINLPGQLTKDIMDGKKQAKEAASSIEGLIESDLMLRFCSKKQREIDSGGIAVVTQKLTALGAQLRGLDDQRKKLAA